MQAPVWNLKIVFMVALSLVAAHGCKNQENPSTGQNSETSSKIANIKPTPTPKERALKAKDALFQRLSSELMAAMSQGGPSAAIEVCNQKASLIAAEVGREHHVAIGRTSFRLRNPGNQAPQWAGKFVEQRVTEPQFVQLDNQVTAALLPIHVKAQCLICHGPTNQIADDVKQQLAQQYPDDRATGFREGDLRGWFWVEVPHTMAAGQ